MMSHQAFLNETWTGDAASAATGRIGVERSLANAISAVLVRLAAVYRSGAWQIENAREMVLRPVRIAEGAGYAVRGDGIVDPSAKISWLTMVLPEMPRRDVLILDIQRDAAALSVDITTGLSEAGGVGRNVCQALGSTVGELLDAAKSAAPNPAAEPAGGADEERFSVSLVPDWAAMIAAATIGVYMDLTKEGPERAAVAAGDDLASGIATKKGPAGAVLGVVPAISNDIEAGMHPTEAVVTEGVGAPLGYRAGMGAGTAMGAAVEKYTDPITGVVAGVLVGAVASAGAALGTSRVFQSVWELLDGE